MTVASASVCALELVAVALCALELVSYGWVQRQTDLSAVVRNEIRHQTAWRRLCRGIMPQKLAD